MTKRAQSKFLGVLVTALFCGAMSQAQATPLDKLSGQSLAVGNLVFSNFSWPSFIGLGASNVDVQGLLVTDPGTGKKTAGLRFVMIYQADASSACAPITRWHRADAFGHLAGAECASALGVVPPRGPSLRGGTPTTLGKSLAAVCATGVGAGGTLPCLMSSRR